MPMTSEQAREFSQKLTLYETRLGIKTKKGAKIVGVLVEMGLMRNDHEGVRLDGVSNWFSLRECEVTVLDDREAKNRG